MFIGGYQDRSLGELRELSAKAEPGKERLVIITEIWKRFCSSSLYGSFQETLQIEAIEPTAEMQCVYKEIWNQHKPLANAAIDSPNSKLQNHKKLFFFLYRFYEKWKGEFSEDPETQRIVKDFFWSLRDFTEMEILLSMFSLEGADLSGIPLSIRVKFIGDFFISMKKENVAFSLFATFLSKIGEEEQIALLSYLHEKKEDLFINEAAFYQKEPSFTSMKIFFRRVLDEEYLGIGPVIDKADNFAALCSLIYLVREGVSIERLSLGEPMIWALQEILNVELQEFSDSKIARQFLQYKAVSFFRAICKHPVYKQQTCAVFTAVLEGLSSERKAYLLSFCLEGDLLQLAVKVVSSENPMLTSSLAIFFAKKLERPLSLLSAMSAGELRAFVCLKEKMYGLLDFKNKESLVSSLQKLSVEEVVDFFKNACHIERDAEVFSRYLRSLTEEEQASFLRKELFSYIRESLRFGFEETRVSLQGFLAKEISSFFEDSSLSFLGMRVLLYFAQNTLSQKTEEFKDAPLEELSSALKKVWDLQGEEKVKGFFQNIRFENRGLLFTLFLSKFFQDEQKALLQKWQKDKKLSGYIPYILVSENSLELPVLVSFFADKIAEKHQGVSLHDVTTKAKLAALLYVLEPSQYIAVLPEDLEFGLDEMCKASRFGNVITAFIELGGREEYYPLFETYLRKPGKSQELLLQNLYKPEFNGYRRYIENRGSQELFALIKMWKKQSIGKFGELFSGIATYGQLYAVETILKRNAKGSLEHLQDRTTAVTVLALFYKTGCKEELFYTLELLSSQVDFSIILEIVLKFVLRDFSTNLFCELIENIISSHRLKAVIKLKDTTLILAYFYSKLVTRFPGFKVVKLQNMMDVVEKVEDIEDIERLLSICEDKTPIRPSQDLLQLLRLGQRLNLQAQVETIFSLLVQGAPSCKLFLDFMAGESEDVQKNLLESLLQKKENTRYLSYINKVDNSRLSHLILDILALRLVEDLSGLPQSLVTKLMKALSTGLAPFEDILELEEIDLQTVFSFLPNNPSSYELLSLVLELEDFEEQQKELLMDLEDGMRAGYIEFLGRSKNSKVIGKVCSFSIENMQDEYPEVDFTKITPNLGFLKLFAVENFRNILLYQGGDFPVFEGLEMQLYLAWYFGFNNQVMGVFEELPEEVSFSLLGKFFVVMDFQMQIEKEDRALTKEDIGRCFAVSGKMFSFIDRILVRSEEGHNFWMNHIRRIANDGNLAARRGLFLKKGAFLIPHYTPKYMFMKNLYNSSLSRIDNESALEYYEWMSEKTGTPALFQALEEIGLKEQISHKCVYSAEHSRRIFIAKQVVLQVLKNRGVVIDETTSLSFKQFESYFVDEDSEDIARQMKELIRDVFTFWGREASPEILSKTAGLAYQEEDSSLDNLFTAQLFPVFFQSSAFKENLNLPHLWLKDFLNKDFKNMFWLSTGLAAVKLLMPLKSLLEGESSSVGVIENALIPYFSWLRGNPYLRVFMGNAEDLETGSEYQLLSTFRRGFRVICNKMDQRAEDLGLTCYKLLIQKAYENCDFKLLDIILSEICYEQYLLELEKIPEIRNKIVLSKLKDKLQKLDGFFLRKNMLTKKLIYNNIDSPYREKLIESLENPFIIKATYADLL